MAAAKPQEGSPEGRTLGLTTSPILVIHLPEVLLEYLHRKRYRNKKS
jgi:hypothetical protein